MQVIQEKMANSISHMHKVGKKMLLTGITEFYQTGISLMYFQNTQKYCHHCEDSERITEKYSLIQIF